MPQRQHDRHPPVYIIQDEMNDHPYYVNFKDPVIAKEEEEKGEKVEKKDVGKETKSEEDDDAKRQVRKIEDAEKDDKKDTNPATDASDWIPIETSTTTEMSNVKPTFGPRNKPEGYVSKPLDLQQVRINKK